MAADCSFFQSSTVFTMDCPPYCTADGSADGSFSLSSMALTTDWVTCCAADGSRLHIPPLVHGFPDGSHAVLLSGWWWIADSFSRQRFSRRFGCRIAQWMASDFSFFLSSMAFTTFCVPYCSADGSTLCILPLVNGFSDVSRAVLLCGWQLIAYCSTSQWLFQWFARRIAQQMAACCSYFHLSIA